MEWGGREKKIVVTNIIKYMMALSCRVLRRRRKIFPQMIIMSSSLLKYESVLMDGMDCDFYWCCMAKRHSIAYQSRAEIDNKASGGGCHHQLIKIWCLMAIYEWLKHPSIDMMRIINIAISLALSPLSPCIRNLNKCCSSSLFLWSNGIYVS